ncbi:hypothetical protein BDV09DRAFT_177934 [Aspergillus tetrazonus]
MHAAPQYPRPTMSRAKSYPAECVPDHPRWRMHKASVSEVAQKSEDLNQPITESPRQPSMSPNLVVQPIVPRRSLAS